MNDIKWEFSEKLESESVLDDFEIEYVYRLPDDLKMLIKRHNGGIPKKSVFDRPRKGMMLSNLLSFNKKGEETIYMVIHNFLHNGKITMLPFATDGFGNMICYKDGAIVFWNHESDTVENVADSLSIFLDMLHE